jgi:PHS family inorganic phosphate transporter-like MFS transporter
MMAAVFSMQGLGQCAAALVALVITMGFRHHFINVKDVSNCTDGCQTAADQSWRIIIAFGGLPALFGPYYRITIPETPRYTFDVARDIEKGGAELKHTWLAKQKVNQIY